MIHEENGEQQKKFTILGIFTIWLYYVNLILTMLAETPLI